MVRQTVIEVWAQGRDFIVTIGHETADGGALGGYRIVGPKFIYGASKRVARHVVSEYEAREIRNYLPRKQRTKPTKPEGGEVAR